MTTLGHPMGEVELTLLDPAGAPLADAVVTVEQVCHAFAFGDIAFDLVGMVGGPDPAGSRGTRARWDEGALHLGGYAALWLGLFDTATLSSCWGRSEPVQGAPDTERLRRTADWVAQRDVRLKGHPLVWHTVQPDWVLGSSLDEVEGLLRARVPDDGSARLTPRC